jgi:polysaccharide deacetylase 2 family uncharacterized protein YibQ
LRPVTNTIKTAFIFYLIYAVLLTAVTLWLSKTQTMFGAFSNSSHNAENIGIQDLRIKQQEYQKSWRKILQSEGYIPQAVYKSQTGQLLKRIVGTGKIQWVHSTNTIVLPKAATKNSLIRLISKWRDLIYNLGFEVSSTRWGYSNGYLWVKLDSSFRILLAKRYFSLALENLTIVQPVTGFKGQLPGLVPAFPPKLDPIPMGLPKVLPKPNPNISLPKVVVEAPIRVRKHAKVAIIIDDVGYVTEAADEMLKVQAPLTFSILPFGPYSQKYAKAAKERGFEIMLHLPLEPLNPNINSGPGVIKRNFTEEEVADQLSKDLEQVPEAIGTNNHEGSAGTSDDRLMGILMKEIKKRQMFFVDSMTVASSVAFKYARLNKLPFAKREVFIDNQTDLMNKKEALRELMKIALRDGQAIGIGHVREGTAQAIIEMLPEFAKAGIEIVPVSQLVK